MGEKGQRGPATFAMASFDEQAFPYALEILGETRRFRNTGIRRYDIGSNECIYPNFQQYVEAEIADTLLLMYNNPGALLSMKVTQELVCEESSFGAEIFTVGLIVACHEHGLISVCSTCEWFPPTKWKRFNEEVDRAVESYASPGTLNPPEDIAFVARQINKLLQEQLLFSSETRTMWVS